MTNTIKQWEHAEDYTRSLEADYQKQRDSRSASASKPMTRKGKPCKVLPDGAPRRMSDGKNAYRKMNAEQRRQFLCWISDQDSPLNRPKGSE